MLCNEGPPSWWYMESPRTGSSTVERALRRVFPRAVAVYAKHWPILPPEKILKSSPASIITVRNPYSRAVSCWNFFTVPGSISFVDWLKSVKDNGFVGGNIEARPQAFWLQLTNWSDQLRQERLAEDFWATVNRLRGFSAEQTSLPVCNDTGGRWVNRKGHKTTKTDPWWSAYCYHSLSLVRELYDTDFELLAHFYGEDLDSAISTSEG